MANGGEHVETWRPVARHASETVQLMRSVSGILSLANVFSGGRIRSKDESAGMLVTRRRRSVVISYSL